ncbi:MAG TPA: hypothetical protein VGX25_03460 [Actinophytocola sp.]|uniref:hypothetical protein n=1 Tax=Actinophytocola sp. TaxID=1872138 RepID=UPI002DDD7DF9|nr:hypothetical protein [Actinophytocola sp.]HEV2778437.1 hypothetical protein [Actinophytocola sp.]
MSVDDFTPPRGIPAHGNGAAPPARDDTTRYLCAAMHMDPDYTNKAIREYLVEDTRPVPASPGVGAGEVLGEAVAARTRRKLRDIALILLLIGFLLVAPVELLGIWLVVAVLCSMPALARVLKGSGQSAAPTLYLVGGALAIGLLLVFGKDLLAALEDLVDPGPSYDDYGYVYAAESGGSVAGGLAIIVAMLGVLLADRLVVWKHLNERFWPNRLNRTAAPPLAERSVFQFSPDRFLAQLARYLNPRSTIANSATDEPQRMPGGPVPLIVYRDFKPFVGAGVPEDPWSIAVPLERLPDAEPTAELTTDSLYAGIHDEIESLRAAASLAPGRRLRELAVSELVIVSADELIDHLNEPAAADFLRAPGLAPYTLVRRERAQAIKLDPLEWARYYQCYQVETWDRDLVVSVFIHVAVGRGALYVEWTPCVLRPLKKRYREIDQLPRSPLRPAGMALLDLSRLPVSIFGRIQHTLSCIRPLPRNRGAISPDMYGVSTTLRELAADRVVHNYFQLADIDRYLKMMESRLVLAVSRMMRTAGYSPASFDQQAATVVNNSVQIGGSVGGNVVAGSGNRVGADLAAARPGRTK